MANTMFKAEDSGLLVVFMSPGSRVSMEEFHEWYDNEHVPLRIERFATFRSAVRYEVTSTTLTPPSDGDGGVAQPPVCGWGAFYTTSSLATFADKAYTSLREQRSSREAELFTRLAIVDRRIYRLEYDSDLDASISGERKTVGLGVQRERDTTPLLVTNSVDIVPEMVDEYNRWFDEEHAPMLSKVPGWRRSRRFTLIDNAVNGTEAKPTHASAVPKCLGLHEYESDNPEATQQFKDACNTEWRSKVLGEAAKNLIRRERKVCKLYRAWDPIAAIKAEAHSSS